MNTNWKARWGTALLALATLAVMASPSAAAPPNYLQVQGVEVLPQSLNPDGAVFVYDLRNPRNRWSGRGFGYVVVDHGNQLPEEEGCVPVEGGEFQYLSGWRFKHGFVVDGDICTTDDPDVYSVFLYMVTYQGETLLFYGELDHRPLNQFPPGLPTVEGRLYEGLLP
ncbi:hypothetical protein [Roseimaritima ulvae]|uniref:YHS domain protein n=1 Tax=Roseimaritima ulvae TaxID=980254 RepID=A0A5B9R3L2_9BACT|nr:hypothetical protein [Roseimaritima ulvae]QEG40931.1 hypothetical protein UC8_29490 [Roseimaritima ulvae]